MPLKVYEKTAGQSHIEDVYRELGQRLSVSTMTPCPVEFAGAFVKLTAAQSCGKCVPCRIGLLKLGNLIDDVLDGTSVNGSAEETIKLIEELAEHIYLTADCAIGYEAAAVTYTSVKGFSEDFYHHLEHHDCTADTLAPVPCVAGCPAGVDIPGYLALTAAGRFDDAIMLVRKDNPFAAVCSLICEHPCEVHCRRGMVDDPINIRGIKRFAADHALNGTSNDYPLRLFPLESTPSGKTVAVVGGGPAGVSAAFYLTLMGHEVTIYEQGNQLGGMLRYGIPAYRLPRKALDAEIAYLIAHGINVKLNTSVGTDVSLDELRAAYNAVYISIGAHAASKLRIPGEDALGVLSAVELLRKIGDDELPDFSGKSVVVVGGGNVAMDVARTSLRLGARKVTIAYRRRREDMTALRIEIEGAIAEGCELLDLHAPKRVRAQDGAVCALDLQPQMISTIDKNGRALMKDAQVDEVSIACDLVLVAIGQRVESQMFEQAGAETNRDLIAAAHDATLKNMEGVFAGGDCVSGPATAIIAIAAGKVAAHNIDEYLGFDHRIALDVRIPTAFFKSRIRCARSNMKETISTSLHGCFDLVEDGLHAEEASQEASRCLRCDHFGLGALRGGRLTSW